VGILLLFPLIFAFFPQSWRNAGQKYLPSELGHAMTSPSAVSHDFGAWTSLILMVVYVVVIAAIGTALFNRRDA
jgi:hypothetical protein